MKHEIQSAANFICHLLRLNKKPIGELQLKRFRDSLCDHLQRKSALQIIATFGLEMKIAYHKHFLPYSNSLV